MMTIATSPLNHEATILDLQGDAVVLGRLREIGFIRGEHVRVWGRAPFGEPILVEIRGTSVALRKEEAQCVLLKPR
jgi:ferrous iron transport protein A